MDGFAQGLLAGFSTVDNAMQHRKALSLREAALAQQQKNADRNYQLAQDEFGYQKETGDRNYQHTLDRDKTDDEHWNKTFQADQSYKGSLLANAAQQLKMQKETHDFQMNNAKYLQDMQQWEPHNRVLESLISQGKVQEAREYAKANNMPLTIPVVKMLNDTGYTQSILSGGKKLHSIMSAPDAHKDPMATLNAINDNRDTIAPLLQPEADRVIGQIDPVTGKKIVAAKFNHIAPVPDRKDPNHHSPNEVAVFNRVKYDDGSEAIKPITENRSANPKDPVLRADIYGLLGSTSDRVVGAHKIMSSPQGGNYDDAIASAYQPQGLSQKDIDKGAIQVAAGAARGGQPVGPAVDDYKAAWGDSGAKARVQQSQIADTAKKLLEDPEIAKDPSAVDAVNYYVQTGNLGMLNKGDVLKAASKVEDERKKEEKAREKASNDETHRLIKEAYDKQRLPPV
ncbi:TPA: hypothetical protein R3975_001062 [Salmonella enterica subsp. enterica serovar Muenchen]|nr:hypothetical protein [Salmonella enterica subsp. enterica]HEC7511698.1 hypothetical protein [Salmonella enterica subsp. enterica serovar Muenchen]HEC7516256.1 hypothetical protein [Salmonella enterica subsp. enterica serovar Muenchen]HEC7580288.1 hypothetical protein [Salmonella enterica subsp. enterica serovar Muenchen]HEC8714025.1 hypothetical protein [Salmonella enterica subsp. enterica serovar Muenchen]